MATRAIDQLLRLTDQLGSGDFYPTLLQLGSELAAAKSAQVIYFQPSGPPDYLHVVDTPQNTRELYREHFFGRCPMGHFWRQQRAAAVVPVREARRPDTDYDAYFDVFYRSNAVRDDIGMFLPIGGQQAVGLFFERDHSFRPRTVARLRRLLPAVLRLHQTHIRLTVNGLLAEHGYRPADCRVVLYDREHHPVLLSDGNGGFEPPRDDARGPVDESAHRIGPLPPRFALAPGGYLCVTSSQASPEQLLERLERARSVELSRRERDVLTLMLNNHSVKAMAAQLGLSVNTIKTHRRRLFVHLGVHSERELFSLLLPR